MKRQERAELPQRFFHGWLEKRSTRPPPKLADLPPLTTHTHHSPSLSQAQGNAAFSAGGYEAAAAAFGAAIELDASNHVLFSNRSAALVR